MPSHHFRFNRAFCGAMFTAIAGAFALSVAVSPKFASVAHAMSTPTAENVVASTPTSTASSNPTSADIEALRDLKLRLWPKAYREQDTALLDRILDDSFQMIDGSGTISTKAEEMAWVRANKPKYDRFRYEIERIDVYAGVSAIVSGMGTIEFDEKDGVRTVRYRSTNVLVKRDGRWRAVASHVSMLKQTPSL
jgi:ketosteroid isomerase-like protein